MSAIEVFVVVGTGVATSVTLLGVRDTLHRQRNKARTEVWQRHVAALQESHMQMSHVSVDVEYEGGSHTHIEVEPHDSQAAEAALNELRSA